MSEARLNTAVGHTVEGVGGQDAPAARGHAAPAESPLAGTPLDEAVLAESMALSRRITRTRAKSFYYGLRLTPEPKRSALYAIYALMRACDDLADGSDVEGVAVSATSAGGGGEPLEAFCGELAEVIERGTAARCARAGDSIWPAVGHVLATYPVEAEYLWAMIEGQRRDLDHRAYGSFDELSRYCYQVAGVVGLVCIAVWGYRGGEATRQLAEKRGLALQLTNILRDLVEDAGRGRVYLPTDELAAYGYDTESFIRRVLSGKSEKDFERLLDFQVKRAQMYYNESSALDSHIDGSCRPASWALMRVYERLLEKISSDPPRVLTRRVKVGRLEKLGICVRAVRLKKYAAAGERVDL